MHIKAQIDEADRKRAIGLYIPRDRNSHGRTKISYLRDLGRLLYPNWMKVVLWAHSQSFKPLWRDQEFRWINTYANIWKDTKATVSYSHPLEQKPSIANLIHIFGSGHFETLHWLKDSAHEIWFSPLPLSFDDRDVQYPEKHWKELARKVLRKKAEDLGSRPSLNVPNKFILPAWGPEIAKLWKLEPSRTIYLQSENQIEDLIKNTSLRLSQ